MSNFPESYTHSKKKTVELDFFNYATKSDLKHAIGIDTSEFTKKVDLVNLRLKLDN